jgi:hypothetical protein
MPLTIQVREVVVSLKQKTSLVARELIGIPAASDRFDQKRGSIDAASPKIDLVPFVLQASQTQRFEIL